VIQKKIALLGAAGVGKTSLVRRFVDSLFDEKYLTTIGVKVDKRSLRVGADDVTLMIWDIAGAEEHFSVPSSYVKGAAGYLLVADGTRPETLGVAAQIVEQIDRDLGTLPFMLVLNKADLVDAWQAGEAGIAALRDRSVGMVQSSAKTGEGVEAAFARLAEAILAGSPR
jgi:small GTP-binding protein